MLGTGPLAGRTLNSGPDHRTLRLQRAYVFILSTLGISLP